VPGGGEMSGVSVCRLTSVARGSVTVWRHSVRAPLCMIKSRPLEPQRTERAGVVAQAANNKVRRNSRRMRQLRVEIGGFARSNGPHHCKST